MAHQLILDLPLRTALGRTDFLVAPSNSLAVAQVDGWPHWPHGKLVLHGPEGAGKSHLVRVWASDTGAMALPAADLAGVDIPGLAALRHVALEDAEVVAGDPRAEAALFHLHNLLLAEGGRLLLTARRAPTHWPLRLPDLASRMQATATAEISAPDDTLLAAVLVKLFADRQLQVQPALVEYLVPRMERSLAAAQRVVALLDARALATGRPLNRALAAEVIERLPPQQ